MLKINILSKDLDKARKVYVNISKALDNSIDICVKPPRFSKITGRFSVSIESKNIDSANYTLSFNYESIRSEIFREWLNNVTNANN